MKRICLVTAGHLATCPRILKAADTLHEAGYSVRVVSANYIAWAREADQHIRRSRTWSWSVVDYEKYRAPLLYWKTALRFHGTRAATGAMGVSRTRFSFAARASSRAYSELLREALREPADFFYGGTSGAIPVVFAAAQKLGVPFAIDLEDFHSAEQDDSAEARLSHALIARIEKATLGRAAFLTAASAAISEAYRSKYSVPSRVINNTFPLPKAEPAFPAAPPGTLKLYWFSQTIGRNRGLEEVIEAIGLSAVEAELHLRGRSVSDFEESLRTLGSKVAPRLRLTFHPPAAPDEMVQCTSEYEVGLSTEPGFSQNNRLALSNKAFTYILAGLAVIFTDTPGQRSLAIDMGEGARLYPPGDVKMLAAQLRYWAENKDALLRARQAAWRAAQDRWHWEHPCERGTLLDAFNNAIAPA
jgi:glycosyltransferase involved in cell wall biosynthesis